MDLLLSDPYGYMDVFLLILVRILGVVLMVPFLGNSNIPNMAKVAISLFLSVIMINVIPVTPVVSSAYPIDYGILVIKEFITGWLIGYSAYAVFAVLTLAGQFIDYQIGFSMVSVFDPLSQTQITITGNYYYFLYMMLFLLSGADRYIFIALKASFTIIPLGQMMLSQYLYHTVIDFFNGFFLIALQLAAPVFFVMLITNVVLGILARTVPQLNMFVIGFPLKIIFGLLVLYLLSYVFVNLSEIVTKDYMRMLEEVIKGLAPS